MPSLIHLGGVRVKVDGTELLVLGRMLRAMQRRGVDMTPAFWQIDKTLSQFFKAMFETRGAIGGERWAPLRPSTLRWRRKYGQNRGGVSAPLWDTGRSKASLERVGPESIRTITPTSYKRGSTVPHLVLWHQRGYTVRRWGKVAFSQRPGKPASGVASMRRVPPRRVIPQTLPRFLVASWEKAVLDHLVNSGANPRFYQDAGLPVNRFR